MPNFFGQDLATVAEIADALRRHGDASRVTYRAHYVFDERTRDPYAGARLERPAALIGNPPGVLFPWEQVFLLAASCAGSDYPMFAAHLGVPLDRVELLIEGVFDPRGEFGGVHGLETPADAQHCYLALHVRSTLTSTASEEALRGLHRRVVDRNMVLGALRAIPRTDELRVERPAFTSRAAAAGR